jgi:alpha-amylase/alpha-mannosidase (GH57 family)
MAKITFLWHLHQPLYRTADGRVHAPWVLLHAGGEYLTLVHALEHFDLRGQVLNLTPVFLEQLAAYRDRRCDDPLLQALQCPAADLAPEAARELVGWATLVPPQQRHRWHRLEELTDRARAASPEEQTLSVAELRDLQVLLVLAYGAANLRWEPALAEVATHQRDFDEHDRLQAVEWLEGCPARLLTSYRALAQRDGIEIATSPMAHPILPLLIDTAVVPEAWAPLPCPAFPKFAAADDASEQLREGLRMARSFGFAPEGCWPPEGAVSAEAVRMIGESGFRWLAADEGVLAASLGRNVSGETGAGAELFVPWRLAVDGPAIFFRHRALSHYISFAGARQAKEADAAKEFAGKLRRVARACPDNGGILVALDGENPWTDYPDGGAMFLARLGDLLGQSRALRPVTLAQRLGEETPPLLPRLHPGSWINANFATWIGQDEKNRGWELLARTRERGAWRGGQSWLAAQGSDWWWWLGDDNPTLLAPLFDQLFRAHLADACAAAGVDPPPELGESLRAAGVGLQVPFTASWPEPKLDGRATTYFEWAIATRVEAPESHRFLAGASLRAGSGRLWLRVDPRRGVQLPMPVVVTFLANQQRLTWNLPDDLAGACAVATCLEAVLPLPDGPVLVALQAAGERLPITGYWRLELVATEFP